MSAFITGIAHDFPSGVLTNEDLTKEHPEWKAEKIAAKTGIDVRHIASGDECASDLAVRAAEKLFEIPGMCSRQEIDYVLLCTQSPDYFLPPTACLLQDRLGLPVSVGAVDINQGCAGFVYGLGLAKGLIGTGQARNVLLIMAETYSKYLHPEDRSNRTIFGDAATATLVSDAPGGIAAEILDPVYGTDGRRAEALIVRNGASRGRRRRGVDSWSEGAFVRNDDYFFMDGRAVFDFTIRTVPLLVERTLARNGLALSDVDWFIFHQANRFMLEAVRKRMGIGTERFVVHLEGCGNTVSSTIPLALEDLLLRETVRPGERLMLVGFGVGLSLAATVVRMA